MLRFSTIVWNAQAAKVCQAADNCDVTMVAALRLSDMSIQHVGHQGARLTASRGVYFRSSGKLFRGARERSRPSKPKVCQCARWATSFSHGEHYQELRKQDESGLSNWCSYIKKILSAANSCSYCRKPKTQNFISKTEIELSPTGDRNGQTC